VHHAELSPDGALVLMASVDRSARAGACCIGALDDAAQTVEIAEIAAPGSERAANACVDRVLRMIAARYHDPHLSLSVVAREVRFSTWHVSRTLTHRTGLGFVAHLRRARVTAARRLLVQSVLSMKEIAAAVGYPHPNRLDRDFRRMCSVTPSTFRHERVTGRHSSAERQETMRDRKK
jgi:transcriptional regulator GlxA family with amidase domain